MDYNTRQLFTPNKMALIFRFRTSACMSYAKLTYGEQGKLPGRWPDVAQKNKDAERRTEMQVDLKYETARRRMIIGIIGCLLYVAGDFLFAATG